MAFPQVDGAQPRRTGTDASSSPTGSQPRMDADARARAKQLAAQFSAQMELSMMQSLSQMGAGEGGDDGSGMDDGSGGAGGGDLGLGAGFDQMQLMATLFTGLQKRGLSAAQLQAQMSAFGGMGSMVGAGAGSEAQLAQSLLAMVGGVDGAGGAAGAGGAVAPASASKDAAANARIVAQVAREHGVDPVAAVAMMLVESGGNAGAVGDGGTSFGLFQLHEGGMLTAAGLQPQQAFDARTNASVALKSYAHEWSKGHERRTAGQIAAASQRPADPVGYAAKVDATMDRARALLS
ncbi:MAG: hypothetical protein KDC46_11205 [Thermoleophilia bacterium]|nr:hypothetical protein [Thermoleophilia bacterium]